MENGERGQRHGVWVIMECKHCKIDQEEKGWTPYIECPWCEHEFEEILIAYDDEMISCPECDGGFFIDSKFLFKARKS
jgi:hypothetical protein